MHLQLFAVNCIFCPMYDIIMEPGIPKIVDMLHETDETVVSVRVSKNLFRNQKAKFTSFWIPSVGEQVKV